jgi:2,3-bisphosphoglycerate-dependent phosphoglycerate mutase
MEVTRIIAIRHGETAWNADTRIQGHTDVALNAKGLWQARRVGRALQEETFSAVYSSDLQRAFATAQHIAAEAGLPVVAERGLRERCFGGFEGRTFREVEQSLPEAARAWRSRTPDWTPPDGGESLVQLRARVESTVHRLAAQHAGGAIVLVAHGGVLDALYRLATGLPIEAARTWELPNAAINRLLWTPQGLTLVGWSDTVHLDDAALDENIA